MSMNELFIIFAYKMVQKLSELPQQRSQWIVLSIILALASTSERLLI